MPQVITSAAPAVSADRNMDPTLKADRTLSSMKATGCTFLFVAVVEKV